MANADIYKELNEFVKLFETLANRESELLQKLSQADSERDIESKILWADELLELLKATRDRQKRRTNLMISLQDGSSPP